MKTQVAIIGEGPAGLMLGHLLHNAGIDTIIIENKSRKYIEKRVRGKVQTMTRALKRYYEDGKKDYLDRYSDTSLKRTWQVQRFVSMLCYNLHRFPEHNQFEHKMQITELNNMTHSKQAMRAFAQSYTGVPVELYYDLED